jgi:hypothetical protein
MAAAGQQQEDNYAYEEEQERKALLQGLHGPMKQWYNGAEAAWCVRVGVLGCVVEAIGWSISRSIDWLDGLISSIDW